MRKSVRFLLLTGIVLLLAEANIFAQSSSNSIFVQQVFSPAANRNYNTIDSADFIIRIRNQGPNALIGGDQFILSYSISDGTPNGSVDYDTLLQVGTPTMRVGELREFTVHKNIKFNGNKIVAACADVRRGTVLYPNNPNKNSGDCSTFSVGIDENEVKIDKVYFNNNTLFFSLNQPTNTTIEVHDITGKLILSRRLSNKVAQSIPMSNQSKGFYFLRVTNKGGSSAIAKFVVN